MAAVAAAEVRQLQGRLEALEERVFGARGGPDGPRKVAAFRGPGEPLAVG